MSAYNFGVVGNPHETLTGDVARGRGDQVDVNFTRGAPYKIWEDKKCLKLAAIFDNFRLWSWISPERIHILKIGQVLDQLHFLPY